MNRTEHILTCLSEEGGEVGKEVSKALRFGLDDQLTMDPNGPRGTEGPTNRQKIAGEFVDMLGVYQKLVKEGVLPDLGLDRLPVDILERMNRKSEKVESYIGYAKRVGTIDIGTSDAALRFLEAADGKMACGHKIGDLLTGASRIGGDIITQCGACLAARQTSKEVAPHPTDLPLSKRMNADGTVDPQPSEILPFTSTDGPRF